MLFRRLTVFIVAICCCAFAAAESYQARLASQSVLLDIESYQDGLVVVGERGHVLFSQDGEEWSQDIVPSLATLTAVAVIEQHIWAVGHDAVILYKSPQSKAWQVQQFLPAREKPLLDVLFLDEANGITIGAYGSFFRTENGGQTWQLEMHPELLHPFDLEYLEEIRQEDEEFYREELESILPHLNRVTHYNGKLYMAGEAGLLAVSDDMGRSWQRMEVDYEGSFFDIKQTSLGLFAAGLRGNVYRFDVNDQIWLPIESDTTSSFNSIVPMPDARVLLVGNNGRLLTISEDNTVLDQTEEGQPLVNAIHYGESVIGVGSVGIQHLDLSN